MARIAPKCRARKLLWFPPANSRRLPHPRRSRRPVPFPRKGSLMPTAPHIHATAIVDPAAQLGEGTTVGPFAIIEGPVKLGAGCIVRPRAHLIGPLTAGVGNDFGINCVVGERAQHIVYANDPALVAIVDHN